LYLSSASVDCQALTLSGSGNAVAAGNGSYNVSADSDGGSHLDIASTTGFPFLYKAHGAASAIVVQGGGAHNASAILTDHENLLYWGGDNTNFDAAGISTSITANGNFGLSAGGIDANSVGGGYNITFQGIDENVVMPPANMTVQAQSGHCDAVVNFPTCTTYTGLNESQLTNISSITYSPPSGSSFSGWADTVTSVVHYNWGFNQTNTFSIRVYPGIAPPNIVRVSWNGYAVPRIYYTAPDLSACTVSNIQFNPPSGATSVYGLGDNICSVSADTLNGTIFSSFHVTVVSATNIAALYPGDTDGDGVPDWQEIIAGTDWHDPTDRFQVQKTQRVGNDMQISWWGTGGITYQLQGWTFGVNTPQPIGAPVTPTVPRQLITVTDTGALTNKTSKFYRIAVLPQ